MVRLARVVVPGYWHHITQRGNRRLPTFFSDEDYEAYFDLMAAQDGDYSGFDRFGRVVWQKWQNAAGSSVLDRTFYGYDRNSNRLWRADRPDASTASGRDEVYAYDSLNRLVRAKRGTHPSNKAVSDNVPYPGDANRDGTVNVLDYVLVSNNNNEITSEWEKGEMNGDGTVNFLDNGIVATNYDASPTASLTAAQEWSLEALGNWAAFKEGDGTSWSLEQTRLHNEVNEIDVDNIHSNARGDSISATTSATDWIDPKYDAAGNMISGPKPGQEALSSGKGHRYTWDAWNRLVQVEEWTWIDAGEKNGQFDEGEESNVTTIETHRYDGLNRRIQKTIEGAPDVTYDYYYSGYQVVEVHENGDDVYPLEQYVWDIRYVHSPVLRWRDEGTDGQDIETLYYCNDANFNVTALIATDGTPVERYVYDPYGKCTIMEPDWTDPVEWEDSKKNEILFTGHRLDNESGLYYAGARYYDPVLGRWISWDWIGYADGMNLCEYVGSSPCGRVDPKGESSSDEGEPSECLRRLAEKINGLISQAVSYSHVAAKGGYDRGDQGRLTSLGQGAEVVENWNFNVHTTSRAFFLREELTGVTAAAKVAQGPIPLGGVHPVHYVRKSLDNCRGIGEILETNVHESIHQKQQGLSKPETLSPAREWRGVAYSDVGSYAGAIKDDISSVLHLTLEEGFGFRRPQGQCCCPLLLKMAEQIEDRELGWHPSMEGP